MNPSPAQTPNGQAIEIDNLSITFFGNGIVSWGRVGGSCFPGIIDETQAHGAVLPIPVDDLGEIVQALKMNLPEINRALYKAALGRYDSLSLSLE